MTCSARSSPAGYFQMWRTPWQFTDRKVGRLPSTPSEPTRVGHWRSPPQTLRPMSRIKDAIPIAPRSRPSIAPSSKTWRRTLLVSTARTLSGSPRRCWILRAPKGRLRWHPRELAMPEVIGANVDRLVTVEMRSQGIVRGNIVQLYEAARARLGQSLAMQAAMRLRDAVTPGSSVIITTGAGSLPWMPNGETDGPPG